MGGFYCNSLVLRWLHEVLLIVPMLEYCPYQEKSRLRDRQQQLSNSLYYMRRDSAIHKVYKLPFVISQLIPRDSPGGQSVWNRGDLQYRCVWQGKENRENVFSSGAPTDVQVWPYPISTILISIRSLLWWGQAYIVLCSQPKAHWRRACESVHLQKGTVCKQQLPL